MRGATFRTVPDAFVTGVWIDLCPACDAHRPPRPAAPAFIHWYRDPDRDLKALPQLFEDWETETMHTRGWSRTTPDRHGGREDRHRPGRVHGRAAPSPAPDR
ncbi:DUF6300 family protein [Streptomyces sp. NPDC091209]|uniref:DUF6300 family protein n=1 Tax=Streptomyces sp. NPDC091209 TaxID=3365974 RepID=UPI00382FABC3